METRDGVYNSFSCEYIGELVRVYTMRAAAARRTRVSLIKPPALLLLLHPPLSLSLVLFRKLLLHSLFFVFLCPEETYSRGSLLYFSLCLPLRSLDTAFYVFLRVVKN